MINLTFNKMITVIRQIEILIHRQNGNLDFDLDILNSSSNLTFSPLSNGSFNS